MVCDGGRLRDCMAPVLPSGVEGAEGPHPLLPLSPPPGDTLPLLRRPDTGSLLWILLRVDHQGKQACITLDGIVGAKICTCIESLMSFNATKRVYFPLQSKVLVSSGIPGYRTLPSQERPCECHGSGVGKKGYPEGSKMSP